ncbi:MAG TPA: hypothetical protein ENK14_05785, partial [Caldithrix sp.]|nr:hypothetical protein [Caldithrix sp.]
IKEIQMRSRYGVNILMIKRMTDDEKFQQIVPSANEILRPTDKLILLGKNKEIQIFKHIG